MPLNASLSAHLLLPWSIAGTPKIDLSLVFYSPKRRPREEFGLLLKQFLVWRTCSHSRVTIMALFVTKRIYHRDRCAVCGVFLGHRPHHTSISMEFTLLLSNVAHVIVAPVAGIAQFVTKMPVVNSSVNYVQKSFKMGKQRLNIATKYW